MLYRFKSGARGEVIMSERAGDQMLAIIGKQPVSMGILAAASLPVAISALEQAASAQPDWTDGTGHDAVSLCQSIWLLLDMFKRAQLAQAAVVWGI
jgi:Domain of unknown function (DUF1840)